MRNISCALTTRQIKERTKDVTRRIGWENLKVGEKLCVCEKVMGRRNGEALVRLVVIEVVSVRREPLCALTQDPVYGQEECRREGFPEMKPWQFVAFFTEEIEGSSPATKVTRIEFRYTDDPLPQ